MITVVIPALNEAKTIARVVASARRSPGVTEVLVIDDGSIDGTRKLAADAGARVLTSSMLGKGASMRDGRDAAATEIVVYLDGDLSDLQPNLPTRLALPIVEGEADFVKARFSRAAGRVTTLSARPLIDTFFPELAGIAQPLGGLIAVRRALLDKLRFETDYGVDIGLLIDALAIDARIAQVDIGRIEHDQQPLAELAEMAKQVTRTILARAAQLNRLGGPQVDAASESERRLRAQWPRAIKSLPRVERLALIDMDGTLVDDRFARRLAEETGRTDELAALLDSPDLAPAARTERIAAVFAGVPKLEFEAAAMAMPLMPGAVEAVVALRRQGFRVGLLSDSFHIATEVVRRRVFADFSIAHVLHFYAGAATGHVSLCRAMVDRRGGCGEHRLCKGNALHRLCRMWQVPPHNVVAVGDHEPDICMLRAAGQSFAFRPKTPRVAAAARHTLREDLREMLAYIKPPAAPRRVRLPFVGFAV